MGKPDNSCKKEPASAGPDKCKKDKTARKCCSCHIPNFLRKCCLCKCLPSDIWVMASFPKDKKKGARSADGICEKQKKKCKPAGGSQSNISLQCPPNPCPDLPRSDCDRKKECDPKPHCKEPKRVKRMSHSPVASPCASPATSCDRVPKRDSSCHKPCPPPPRRRRSCSPSPQSCPSSDSESNASCSKRDRSSPCEKYRAKKEKMCNDPCYCDCEEDLKEYKRCRKAKEKSDKELEKLERQCLKQIEKDLKSSRKNNKQDKQEKSEEKKEQRRREKECKKEERAIEKEEKQREKEYRREQKDEVKRCKSREKCQKQVRKDERKDRKRSLSRDKKIKKSCEKLCKKNPQLCKCTCPDNKTQFVRKGQYCCVKCDCKCSQSINSLAEEVAAESSSRSRSVCS